MSQSESRATLTGEAHQSFAEVERERMKRTQQAVLGVCFTCCALLIVLGVASGDMFPVRLCIAGCIGFGAAYVALRREAFLVTSLLISLVSLGIVGVTAATGLGLHDLSFGAVPVIIIYAGMTLSKRQFVGVLLVVVALVIGLDLNSRAHWITQRATPSSVASDLVVIAVVVGATAYAVWMLIEGSRQGLELAHTEIERRREVEAALEQLSTHDALTGVFSRHFFDTELARLENSRLYPVSVIVADVDGLKAVNDEFGHAEGDRHLKRASLVLASMVRAEDVLARIGGDEFAILLPQTDQSTALEAVNRISTCFDTTAEQPTISMSLGCATTDHGGLEVVLARADGLMYASKAARRLDLATRQA